LAAVPAAALALAGPAAAADCQGADGPADGPQAVHATLCLLNAERTSRGLQPLVQDGRLDAAARGFARDMVTRRFFDHTSPGGGTILSRLRAVGWLPASGAWSAGENIAWGSGELATPERIVDSWMHSAGHRANILQPRFDEIGIGIAAGAPQGGVPGPAGTYVTDLGARAAADPSPTAKPAKRTGSR